MLFNSSPILKPGFESVLMFSFVVVVFFCSLYVLFFFVSLFMSSLRFSGGL